MTTATPAATDDGLDDVFRALGDPTRRAMLRLLAGGDRTVGELAAPADADAWLRFYAAFWAG